MKSVLYITYVDYHINNFHGVKTKIADQISSLCSSGYEVDRINQYCKSAQKVNVKTGEAISYKSYLLKRFSIYKAIKEAVRLKSYSAAYIRFQFFSEDVRKILKLLQSHNIKVLMELPTFPYDGELRQQGIKGVFKLICDLIYRNVCSKNINIFITQGNHNMIYRTPTLKVLNGLDYSKHSLRHIKQPERNNVKLVAVASMLPWHGYDRVIVGMANYYKKYNANENTTVSFHLIGDGKEITKYKKLVKKYYLEDYVKFHGMLNGKQLDNTISCFDIAVGSLAAFRINIEMLSTLKSREYCAWGFPSINCTETDILSEDDPYCLFVPEDESPLEIDAIVNFFNNVYFGKETAIDVARIIRNDAIECSDAQIVFQPIIEFLNGVTNNEE